MIAAGVNVKALSTFMGHANIRITLDQYGHLLPGAEDVAADLLNAFLARQLAGAEDDPTATHPAQSHLQSVLTSQGDTVLLSPLQSSAEVQATRGSSGTRVALYRLRNGDCHGESVRFYTSMLLRFPARFARPYPNGPSRPNCAPATARLSPLLGEVGRSGASPRAGMP
jgi:hypothetical protein